jgi:hypothetical protein
VNVSFLTIHSMTPFYREIAVRLQARGHRITWISPSDRWSTWLIEGGVAPDQLLNLTAFASEWRSGVSNLSGLSAFEERATKSVRDLVMMDRLLVERDPETALAYAAACVRHAADFLATHQVEVVFAEPSYLLAYIVVETCRDRGIDSFAFDTVRFPDGRFAFYEGMNQQAIASEAQASSEDRRSAAEYHQRFVATAERPISFYAYLRPPRLSPVLAWKLVRNLRRVLSDPADESGFPVRRMVRDQLWRSWNYQAVRRWTGLTRPAQPTPRPFILYGLHKQPEIGLDVLASYLSNQEELIRSIARSLPVTHDLYVKPHANDLGGRSRAFFKRLVQIPRVRVIDPLADTHALIRASDLVLSVSGTMAYEAGLYGSRAITFAPMYFAPVLMASGLDPYQLRLQDMLEFLGRPHPKDDPAAASPAEFLATVFAKSYPGVVGDPLVDARCMEPSNLDLLAEGFDRFLASRTKSSASITPRSHGDRPQSSARQSASS